MASDHDPHRRGDNTSARPDGGGGGRTASARRRSPRVRVEVNVNELTGTVSWRTIRPGTPIGTRGRGKGADAQRSERPDATLSRRPQAAALRSAGLDPAGSRARGAAPIPTHPAAVRAAVSTPVDSLSPDQMNSLLARIGKLRSQLAGDLGRGARMPSAVAARLRSAASPANVHALSAAHAASVRASGHRAGRANRPAAPATGAAPAPGPRR
ncbi:hypothetical protein ABT186_15565 [Streptomyces sp. NPDC001634]|uniref:hypothetical protein n=1 Tax=Streptomyces sp. NPDC001634 TaxID=3154390 RepID=UPI00331AC9BE